MHMSPSQVLDLDVGADRGEHAVISFKKVLFTKDLRTAHGLRIRPFIGPYNVGS